MKTLKTSCPKIAKKRASQCYVLFCKAVEGVRKLAQHKSLEEAIVYYDGIIESMQEIHEAEMKLVKVEAENREMEFLFEILGMQEQFKKDTEQANALAEKFGELVTRFSDSKEKIELREGTLKEREEKSEKLESLLQHTAEVLDVPLAKTYFSDLPTFKDFFENEYLQIEAIGEEHYSRLKGYIENFLKIVGNKKVHEYSKTDIKTYIRVLERYPSNHGRSKYDSERTPQELIERAVQQETGTLSIATLKKHTGYVKSVFVSAAEEYSFSSEKKIRDVFNAVKFAKFVPPKKPRKIWTIKQLNAFFQTPIWTGTGSKTETQRHKKGKKIIRDAYWWLPVASLYTGCRLEELAQLEHDDLHFTEETNHPFILVHDEGDRRVKTPKSIRQVPIHADLVELGFLKLFKKVKKGKIFNTLKLGGNPKKYGHYYSKNFTTYRQECNIYEERRDFHSLRKTFITEMRMSAKVDILTVAAICGHDDEVADKYSRIETENYTDYGIEFLCEAVAKLDYKKRGLKIDHLLK